MTNNNSIYVRVADGVGNHVVCPVESLADPAKVGDEELDNCVDDAVVGRYAGNIKIVG